MFLVYGGVFALSCCCPAVAGASVLFVLMHGPGAASAFGVLDAWANAKAADMPQLPNKRKKQRPLQPTGL